MEFAFFKNLNVMPFNINENEYKKIPFFKESKQNFFEYLFISITLTEITMETL